MILGSICPTEIVEIGWGCKSAIYSWVVRGFSFVFFFNQGAAALPSVANLFGQLLPQQG
jgi:hypothetical protein